jgi:hypothetical protein
MKRVEFVNDRMSYVILRGRWCDIIVLNAHAPTEDKIDDVKGSFFEELEHVINTFPKHHTKILLGDFIAKVGIKAHYQNDDRSFRPADHYPVVAKVRKRLAVSKQRTHRVHMERFNLKKLNEVEGKEQYRVDISNRFATLENFDTGVDINRAWETTRENIRISAKESRGYYELKKHKPWFDVGCSKLLDQRKEAKMQ